MLRKTALLSVLLGTAAAARAAVQVDVDVNVKHSVGGISTFDREKFSTVHASHTTGDMDETVMHDFINGRDVYFGRDTGYIGWYSKNQIEEDPVKPGWSQVSGSTYSIAAQGAASRNSYAGQTWRHAYESRAALDIVCAQFSPFWPGSETMRGGWSFSAADTAAEPFGSATGNHMGNFLNHFYGTAANGYAGRPLPAYVEILNEPDYPLFDSSSDPMYGTSTWEELFNYHNTVADQIRLLNQEVKIGGFCPSHPDLSNHDFEEWTERYKRFLDICATNMDFFSIHIYDIYDDYASDGPHIKKGSNLEATFDMIEHYSYLKKGQPLPFVVSEFGGRDRRLEAYDWRPIMWTPERDWAAIKSMNSMLMSFADRPHIIDKAIPFIMLKEEWNWDYYGYPHNWRLFRKEGETNATPSYTGDWVYTDYIKFYDLWKNVRGTRVRIATADPDIQVDAYVSSNQLFVVLNNLNENSVQADLSLFGKYGNAVQTLVEKNLYWDGEETVLEENVHIGNPGQVQLRAEGAAVLEYAFSDSIQVDETADEVKYYASTNFLPIVSGQANVFSINDVSEDACGEGVLRLGAGRNQALSRQPVVRFNGTALDVPTDFMGHEGDGRNDFMGQLNIPVPYGLIQSSNIVSITYPDTGGHISSLSFRVFTFSSDIHAAREGSISIDYASVVGNRFILGFTNGPQNGFFSLLSKTNLVTAGWSTNLTELPIDETGCGAVTNPMAHTVEFFRLVGSEAPTGALTALFDWSDFNGTWWSDGYGYVETDNGLSLVHGGRATAHENGNAFKASYSQDEVDGTFTVNIGGVSQRFVVTSVDISASTDAVPQGEPLVRGMLDGVEQWSIDPVENGNFQTYTTATTGELNLAIDEIIWSAPYDPDGAVLTWNNRIDNLAVEIVP
ncbi:hypothetical protein [Pontiella agarivorans]|uniref:hypothetical protein n=1 Tax=Pontiella agarivorans TaxID=3038953 RepID=UPI002AD557B4|nr:hypothetical protein [Pontiella agarivorans]